MAFTLNLELVQSLAPKEDAYRDARYVVSRGAVTAYTQSEDKTLVWANVTGSGKNPYNVSADLAANPERPVLRCSCPSRQHPCKHALALAICIAEGRAAKSAKPPADLLEKREKYIARLGSAEAEEAPKKEESPEKKAAREAKAEATKKAAAQKLAQAQVEALTTLEKFVIDLVSTGLGAINEKTLRSIDEQARRMNDAGLRGAHGLLMHFAAACKDDKSRSEKAAKKAAKKKPKKGTAEEATEATTDSTKALHDRHAKLASLLSRLWVTVRKGQKMLAGKLDPDETSSENDAQMESLLGRAWKLPELKERGYWATNRSFVELFHEKTDDKILEMVMTRGYLLDLETGTVYMDWSAIPYMALRHAAGNMRQARMGALSVGECAIYPGDVANRRVRWDEKSGTASETPLEAKHFDRVKALSKSLDDAMKLFREQLKNPLAPHDAVVLIDAARYGTIADGTYVLEDQNGTRLVLRDHPQAKESTLPNFAHVGGAFGAGPTAIRLWFDLGERVVYGQPMAVFAGQNHLRLGM